VQGEPDRVENFPSLPDQIAVPDSEHSEVIVVQPAIPALVLRAPRVMRPVKLNDQSRLEANEVSNERTKGNLPPELELGEAAIPKKAPENALVICLAAAKRPRN
jgi:hypothetical protein